MPEDAGSAFAEASVSLDRKKNGELCDEKLKIEAIYRVLSVLDSKASALMRLDGVMLAAAAVILTSSVGPLIYADGMAKVIMVLAALAITLCLAIISIDWSFFRFVKAKDDDGHAFDEEIKYLRKVMVFRTLVYRLAWLFSLASGLMFIWLSVSIIWR